MAIGRGARTAWRARASTRVDKIPTRALSRFGDLLLNGLSVHLHEDQRPVGILAEDPDRGAHGSGATVQTLPQPSGRPLTAAASGDFVLVLLEPFTGEDPEDVLRLADPAPFLRRPFD